MGRFELVEKLSCDPEFSFFRIFKALTDSFLCIGSGGNVEQMLIGFSVLNHGRNIPLHLRHHGALTFFQLFHKTPNWHLIGCDQLCTRTQNLTTDTLIKTDLHRSSL